MGLDIEEEWPFTLNEKKVVVENEKADLFIIFYFIPKLHDAINLAFTSVLQYFHFGPGQRQKYQVL